MRLVTVQDKAAHDELMEVGVLRCKPERSEFLQDFKLRYDWMVEKMRMIVGEPPDGVSYPIWAHFRLNHRPAKADLRTERFLELGKRPCDHYIITVDVPSEKVLLSDMDYFICVLNFWYCHPGGSQDKGYDAAYARIEGLPEDQRDAAIIKSWDNILRVNYDNEELKKACCVQATFWELRREEVVDVRLVQGKGEG